MRTPFIGFINNVKPGSNQEIEVDQGKKNEEVKENGKYSFRSQVSGLLFMGVRNCCAIQVSGFNLDNCSALFFYRTDANDQG